MADPKPLTVTASDWAALIALSVLWGGAFMFAKLAVFEIPPQTLSLARVAIAAVTILIVMRIMGMPPPSAAMLPAYMVFGLFNNAIPFSLIFWAQTEIASGLASILNATTPMFTLLIAHFWTVDNKFTAPRVVGLIAGFIGVAIMIGPDLLGQLGAHAFAELACLLASLSYSIGGVYARRFRNEHPLTITGATLIGSTIILAPIAAIVDRPWELPGPSMTALAATLALATISTAFAYLLYFRVLARAGATNAMLVTLLIPVSAVLLGTIVLHERLTINQIAGAAVIALGLVILDGRLVRFVAGRLRGHAAESS